MAATGQSPSRCIQTSKLTHQPGRNARAERLNERLRGAQRVNIADDSFQLDLGAFEAPAASTSPEAEPEPEPEPRSSAKRRKLDSGASVPAPQPPPSRPQNPYSLPNTSKESVGQSATAQRSAPAGRPANAPAPADPEPGNLESLPPPSSVHRSPSLVRNRVIEEIEESPADRPGSGQRRNIPEAALASTSRLQSALRSDTSVSANSSPTTYKSRRSDAAQSVRSARSVRQTPSRSPQADVDELSPDGPPELPSIAEETPTRATAPEDEPEVETEPVDEPGGDEATEVGDAEAAKALRRERPRPSPRVTSPELGSIDHRQHGEDEPSPEPEQPRRKRGRPSPAKQKQGGPKPRAKPAKPAPNAKAAAQSKPRGRPKASPKRKRQTSEEGDPDASIALTVHRFVNHRNRDGDDTDPLQLEIPFANRSGESVVDVFAEVCDEVIEHTIGQFQGVVDSSTDASKKKEFRVKVRAVEAYRAVLSSRLLEHVSYTALSFRSSADLM